MLREWKIAKNFSGPFVMLHFNKLPGVPVQMCITSLTQIPLLMAQQ